MFFFKWLLYGCWGLPTNRDIASMGSCIYIFGRCISAAPCFENVEKGLKKWLFQKKGRQQRRHFWGQECKICYTPWRPYRAEPVTCRDCGQLICTCEDKDERHVDPEKDHRSDLCLKCKSGDFCVEKKRFVRRREKYVGPVQELVCIPNQSEYYNRRKYLVPDDHRELLKYNPTIKRGTNSISSTKICLDF